MTIGAIVFLAFIILCGIGIAAFCIWWYITCKRKTKGALISAVITVILTIVISALFIWYRTVSASGQRAVKDQRSNLNGGIERVVSVYDVGGKLIAQYSGKFDIDTDRNSYILFDDEEGKRHIIYYTTATIIVDEK